MKRYRHLALTLGVALLTFAPLRAERHHDPLTQLEIDQLRDAMLDPDTRLKLYVKFTRQRITDLEQMRNDPKVKDRAKQTHDMLEDFLAVYDELNDNVDMYVGRKDDIRKPLKQIIEADTEFQAKLRAIKDAPVSSPADAKDYDFVLSNAIETVDASADDHRKTVEEVEEYVKRKKKTKSDH
jgi:hypothetical protein